MTLLVYVRVAKRAMYRLMLMLKLRISQYDYLFHFQLCLFFAIEFIHVSNWKWEKKNHN